MVIKRRPNETLESMLGRFHRQSADIMAELKKREFYMKPSVKRKKKSEAARKANRKKR